MGGELIGTRHPAVERLKGILAPEGATEEGLIVHKILGRNEAIHAEFYGSGISCYINKDQEPIMEFRVGQNGLESLWFRKMTISIPGEGGPTYPVSLREGTHISTRYSPSGFMVDEKDIEMFRGLGDYLVDWVEGTIKRNGFMALPVQLCSELGIY